MPLRDYEAFFHPDQAGRMTTAFETAWQKLATSLGPAQNEKEAANQTRGVHRHLCARYWRGGGRLADEALRCLHETHLMNHDVPLT
jgi:hypothetical protein